MIIDLISKNNNELAIGDMVRFCILKDSWSFWPDKDILQEGIVESIAHMHGSLFTTIRSHGTAWGFDRNQYEIKNISRTYDGMAQIEKLYGLEARNRIKLQKPDPPRKRYCFYCDKEIGEDRLNRTKGWEGWCSDECAAASPDDNYA